MKTNWFLITGIYLLVTASSASKDCPAVIKIDCSQEVAGYLTLLRTKFKAMQK